MRSSTLIRAYQRSRFLRNLMLVLFGIMVIATLLWVTPWVPIGLTTDDYNSEAGVAVALAFGAWLAAFGAVYLRDKSNRYEQTLVTWSSVHDELGDLLRREYFYERAVIESVRADRTGVSYGVFAVRFSTNENANSAETATALEALAGLIRQTDSIAALGPQEVGVLGAGMGTREAPGFAYRLKSTIEKATGATDGDQVSVGWAIWGTDGTDAGTLLGMARSRMQHKNALREWAHAVDTREAAVATQDVLEEAEPDLDEPAASTSHLHIVSRPPSSDEPNRDGTAA